MTETDKERQERTGLSSLEQGEQEAAAVAKKPEHRVTLKTLEDKVDVVEYLYPQNIPHMTICVIVLMNGFALVGESAPADAENFDEDLGRKFAFENALRKLWQLEGYLMRERLAAETEDDEDNDEDGATTGAPV